MYRILTEDKNRESILRLLDDSFDGYTVTEAIRAWHGTRERSLAIDLIDVEYRDVESVAQGIRELNEQESVLILQFTAWPTFITADRPFPRQDVTFPEPATLT